MDASFVRQSISNSWDDYLSKNMEEPCNSRLVEESVDSESKAANTGFTMLVDDNRGYFELGSVRQEL
jgi:hypothetical protein